MNVRRRWGGLLLTEPVSASHQPLSNNTLCSARRRHSGLTPFLLKEVSTRPVITEEGLCSWIWILHSATSLTNTARDAHAHSDEQRDVKRKENKPLTCPYCTHTCLHPSLRDSQLDTQSHLCSRSHAAPLPLSWQQLVRWREILVV